MVAHVLASTAPVTGSPLRAWKRSIAPRVIGPKIPSSSTPTWRWTATTVSPVSPSDSRAPDGRWIEEREEPGAAAATAFPDDALATAANGSAVGAAATDALTAN